MTTKRVRQLGLTGLAVLFLVACGQKGPLRMPDDEPEKQSINQDVTTDKTDVDTGQNAVEGKQ